MLEVSAVEAFSDNYIWLIHGADYRTRVAVVDPGDAAPVIDALQSRGLQPTAILVTHHHYDHMGGAAALAERYEAPVFGPAGLPLAALDHPVRDGDRADLPELGLSFAVSEIPGHTLDHIAFFGHGALFCGDTLFSAGCGRLFEGTARQMFDSLGRLRALPPETHMYCGHEYTVANLEFALNVEPGNEAACGYLAEARQRRAAGTPTLPSTLARERAVNPFLRCDLPAVQDAVADHARKPLRDDALETFAALRAWKDTFR